MSTPYTITPDQSQSISKPEEAFGTTRLLPTVDQIPVGFKVSSPSVEAQPYIELVNAIFYGKPLPPGDIEFIAGHKQDAVVKCVRAHLISFAPKHEHKISGVAFMLSHMARLDDPFPSRT